jgi:menaquinone-dependent protoporphyrinogen oxidase
VYLGRWLAPAQDFVIRFRNELAQRPVWLFSSGPVGDPSGNPARSLTQGAADITAIRHDISPQDHHVFAGKLAPEALSLPHASQVIFHGISGDFRDWAKIRQWADNIARQLRGGLGERAAACVAGEQQGPGCSLAAR